MQKQLVKYIIASVSITILMLVIVWGLQALVTLIFPSNSTAETPVPSRYYSTATDFTPCCGTSNSNCAIKE